VAASGGDHSVLGLRYHRDVERAHGLPESRRQVPFTGPGGRQGRRDRTYEKYAVVIELGGRLAHPAEGQWKDKARDNAAAVAGLQSLRYGLERRQASAVRYCCPGSKSAATPGLGRSSAVMLACLSRCEDSG